MMKVFLLSALCCAALVAVAADGAAAAAAAAATGNRNVKGADAVAAAGRAARAGLAMGRVDPVPVTEVQRTAAQVAADTAAAREALAALEARAQVADDDDAAVRQEQQEQRRQTGQETGGGDPDAPSCPLNPLLRPTGAVQPGVVGRCAWYASDEYTCCTAGELGFPAPLDQDSADRAAEDPPFERKCKSVSRPCAEIFELLACRVCSSRQESWTSWEGSLLSPDVQINETICGDFLDKLISRCSGDEMWVNDDEPAVEPVGTFQTALASDQDPGKCKSFDDFDRDELAAALGFDIGSSDCFNAAPSNRQTTSLALAATLVVALFAALQM